MLERSSRAAADERSRRISLALNGESVSLDCSGALFWETHQLLAVADLHFEKGSAIAARTRQFLPPYDTQATLAKLQNCIDAYAPRIVVCLGDNFHDAEGPSRLDAGAQAGIRALMKGRRFIWIEGNHDGFSALQLGGESSRAFRLGSLCFRHEPSSDDVLGEVCGHLHPVATAPTRANALRRRCFVSDGRRLILPAFGAYTGGLDVFDPAISEQFPDGFNAYLLGRDRVYPFGHQHLIAK